MVRFGGAAGGVRSNTACPIFARTSPLAHPSPHAFVCYFNLYWRLCTHGRAASPNSQAPYPDATLRYCPRCHGAFQALGVSGLCRPSPARLPYRMQSALKNSRHKRSLHTPLPASSFQQLKTPSGKQQNLNSKQRSPSGMAVSHMHVMSMYTYTLLHRNAREAETHAATVVPEADTAIKELRILAADIRVGAASVWLFLHDRHEG